MVMARLHVISGNCGCNDEFEYKYEPEWGDYGDGTFEDEVVIHCKNCCTNHNLSDNASKEIKDNAR